MLTSLFAFPSDLAAEGVAEVYDRIRGLGVDAVTLAVAYHQARDVTPHRPTGRLVHRADGVFLPLPRSLWADVRLRPPTQPEDEMAATARFFAAGVPALAWTVFLHNTTLGTRYPDACAVNCFGDPLRADLCPANPDVGDYAVALARTVVATTGAPVVAEALSYGTFDHGHHHERCFVPLGPGERVLLGLCFCVHCVQVAAAGGIDPDRLRAVVADHLDAALSGDLPPTPAERNALCEVAGEDIDGLLTARQGVVTALARRVADAVHADGGELVFLDLTGAVLGYDSGTPAGDPVAAQGWRIGVDVAALAASVDGFACLGYARDAARLRLDVASIVDGVTGRCPVRVVLRPGWPDTVDAAHLAGKVSTCAALGVDAVDFYNYGMYPWSVLDRIRSV